MSVGFRNITKCQIKEDVSASDTTILLENTADYVPFTASPGDYVYAVLINHEHTETVKIDVAASSINGLSVGRGQEYTSARAWNRGTLFYQELTANSLSLLMQKEVFRTFAYNPNGIIAPEYANEKVYQTGDDSCEIRWWKSINDTNLVWTLIAGTICAGEVWLDTVDWDWDIPPAWEWPTIVYKVAPPIYLPSAGLYSLAQEVEIFCPTLNSTTYYTDDGTTPDDNSTEYTSLISLSVDTTLKAIAYKPSFGESPVVEAEYKFPPLWSTLGLGYRTAFGQLENGELWGWGRNDHGQLAQGSASAYEWLPIKVSALTTWTDLAGGEYSIFGVKSDGTLWACGRNDHGQLGLGDTTVRHDLTQVGTATNWAKIYSSYWNTYGIKTDGSLWVWGYNADSALGLGDTNERHSPVQLGALTNYASIAASNNNAIAIKTDGTLWGWGLNWGGELGLGDRNPRTTPAQISALTTWSEVSLGAYYHCLALKSDGTMWAWGDNLRGTCGQGSSGEATRWDYLTPTRIGTLATWKAVAVNGSGACMAVMTSGLLWAWGYGSHGQLGLGNEDTYTTPWSVDLSTDWDRPVKSPFLAMFVLNTDKTLYATGYYSYALLGLGEITEDVLTLTQMREVS